MYWIQIFIAVVIGFILGILFYFAAWHRRDRAADEKKPIEQTKFVSDKERKKKVEHDVDLEVKKRITKLFHTDRKPAKIYVSNVPSDAKEEELRTLFAEFGEVTSVTLVTDKFSGELRGFGFVEMLTEAEAEQAIISLNGKTIRGRSLHVKPARERSMDRTSGAGRRHDSKERRDWRRKGGRRNKRRRH